MVQFYKRIITAKDWDYYIFEYWGGIDLKKYILSKRSKKVMISEKEAL